MFNKILTTLVLAVGLLSVASAMATGSANFTTWLFFAGLSVYVLLSAWAIEGDG